MTLVRGRGPALLPICVGLALCGCFEDVGTGDGGADSTTGDGDGDGDPTTGDGDGDPTTGDGDGDCSSEGCECAGGQLGYGHLDNIGDDETPASAGNVSAIPLEAICWGANGVGQLGYGHTQNLGDDESLDALETLALGGPVKQIDAGGDHTCAILAETNEVLCWGQNSDGQLGYGHTDTIGDDELPASAGPIALF